MCGNSNISSQKAVLYRKTEVVYFRLSRRVRVVSARLVGWKLTFSWVLNWSHWVSAARVLTWSLTALHHILAWSFRRDPVKGTCLVYRVFRMRKYCFTWKIQASRDSLFLPE